MRTTPLHSDFGVEIHDIDLTTVTAGGLYPEIRTAFEHHSLLLFRNQTWTDTQILQLGRLFGPIENRTDGPEYVSKVSNVGDDGGVILPDDQRLKDLRANMLWHTDSTFLPVPALANIITARVVPTTGGATELVSTRAGYARLPEGLKTLASQIFRHRLSHSRSKVDAELASAAHITKWPEQSWRGVWMNPVTEEEAVYVASHACGIAGMDDDVAQPQIDALIAALTQPEHVYVHQWRVGDVLIWDERATLHRGMPWPYDQARTLASICVTATQSDGLASIQPPV